MVREFQAKMAHIAQAIIQGRYRYTIHGAQQLIGRRLRRHEVEEAIASGEIIEDYPDHHYGPVCLVLGRTDEDKPLHILCSLQEMVDIITVYEPDQKEWEKDLKTRRNVG